MKNLLKKIWWFIWHDNSIASWIVNIILAFLIVKFVIYPGLGLLLGTSYPVVAVVSNSMHHNTDFENWWAENRNFYEKYGFTKEDFKNARFSNGFNKGDIILLVGTKPKDIKEGDVIVYHSRYLANPIIHRVIEKKEIENKTMFRMKGDNNPVPDAEIVTPSQIVGKAVVRVPAIGWIKIAFLKILGFG